MASVAAGLFANNRVFVYVSTRTEWNTRGCRPLKLPWKKSNMVETHGDVLALKHGSSRVVFFDFLLKRTPLL